MAFGSAAADLASEENEYQPSGGPFFYHHETAKWPRYKHTFYLPSQGVELVRPSQQLSIQWTNERPGKPHRLDSQLLQVSSEGLTLKYKSLNVFILCSHWYANADADLDHMQKSYWVVLVG